MAKLHFAHEYKAGSGPPGIIPYIRQLIVYSLTFMV